jgi:predicted HAD superfamily hydrolase
MKNSLLEKEFTQLLQNVNLKVISFDIFETLVFRNVNNPVDIFSLVGKHKYVKNIYDNPETFKQFRIQAENKARSVNSKLEDVTLELIYNELPLTQEQKKKIIKLELKEEYKSLYINKQIQKWINKALKVGKKVILISDMYLSKKELNYLVTSKLKDEKSIYKIYVSNEYDATKATGNLYPIVLKDLQISANEILHIGDNKYSDVQMAQKSGINSLYYNCDKYIKDILKIESNYIQHSSKNNNFRIQASLLNSYIKEEERFFFNLGASIFGPVLWEFSHWITELAHKENISQVNCIMREGRIFSKYISKINKELDVNLIYASRKSTFLPAVNIDMLEEDGFNFYKYRKFSIKNFYDLFKLGIKDQFILEHSDEPLESANKFQYKHINLLDYITQDFKNRKEEVCTNIQSENRSFKTYLQQCSYTSDSILIDFGGTGSILENISNAMGSKHTQKLNVLFYMHSSGFEKMLKERTLTFLPFTQKTSQKIERLRRSPEFIEILFNGVNQTTINYTMNQDGTIEAITDFPYNDIKETRTLSKAFDKGIDAFFDIVRIHTPNQKLYSSETILDIISRLIEIPNIVEAINLGNLYHDEGYGSSLLEQLVTQEHRDSIKEAKIQKAYYSNSVNSAYKIGKIPWVQGVITQLNEDYIVNVNGLKTKGINEDSIHKIVEILTQDLHISEVYIYGAGQFFIELRPELNKIGVNIKKIIDTRAKFAPFKIDDFNVTSIEDSNITDTSTIIVSSAVFAIDITQTIMDFAKSKNYKLKVINFYNGLLTT